jgi:hypothetical protein
VQYPIIDAARRRLSAWLGLPTKHPTIEAAQRHLSAWLELPMPPVIAPSEMWGTNTSIIDPVIRESNTPEELISRITALAPISLGISSEDPGFNERVSATRAWLNGFGRPLESFPASVRDSPHAWPKAVAMVGDRPVSVAFLYHLSIAAQIEKASGKVDTVLELGSGYGGLARILKLLNPGARFVLCDLPVTLSFAYVFLRHHFPHCTFKALDRAEQLAASPLTADFTFVPAQLAKSIAGLSFNVAVNTSSLSEMTQSAVNYYLDLIQNQTKVEYLYHLNRMGTPEQIGNACSCSYALDRNWEVLEWHWRGRANFYNFIYPETPPLLNLIAKRIPEQARSDALYAGMVKSLRSRLATAPTTSVTAPDAEFNDLTWWRGESNYGTHTNALPSDEWFAAMWDLIRIDRQRADIEAYLNMIRPLRWREVAYYESLLPPA